MSSSSAADGSRACSTRRRRHTRASSSFVMSSSSLRVPEASTLMAGKMRFSESCRSRRISQFPVPLNSSKIPSSIREPVSTRVDAMIVSEPPSSMLRAAPKNRRGGDSAAGAVPPPRVLAAPRAPRLYPPGQAGGRVLETDAPVGDHRGELLDPRPLLRLLRVHPVDVVDPQERHVLLVVLGVADGAGDGVALAQGEPPDLRQRHVDVRLA